MLKKKKTKVQDLESILTAVMKPATGPAAGVAFLPTPPANDFRQLMYLLIHYLRCSGFLDTDDEGMMMVTRLEHLEVIKFDEM
jgi:hypothetical protein